MKSSKLPVLVLVSFVTAASGLFAAEKTPQYVIEHAYDSIIHLGEDPRVVAAVREENAQEKTLREIGRIDEKWIHTVGYDDFIKRLISTPLSQYLEQFRRRRPFYAEIFVTDNQGALVGATDKTSDYWQGDEAKFTSAFNNGKGGIHFSNVVFDESSQAYVVQVSFPVRDEGRAIGTVTVSIDVDEMEKLR
jgi:hypothetical protein